MSENGAEKRFFRNIIKFEGDNQTLVWKHPVENFNMGSQLDVDESQCAVFYKNGQAMDCFTSGKHILSADRLPILGRLMELPSGGQTPFSCKVYFVNLAMPQNIKWGTPQKIGVLDSVSGMHVEIGAGGMFSLAVNDPRKLLVKIVGTTASLTQEDLMGINTTKQGYLRSLIIMQIKSVFARTIRENQLNVVFLDEYMVDLADLLKEKLDERLEEYGLQMAMFTVDRIMLPEDDPDFIRYKRMYGEQHMRVWKEQILTAEARAQAERRIVQEETEQKLKEIRAAGDADAHRIRKRAEADGYFMQAEAEGAELKLKGYTYQDETNRMVSMEAMKHGGDGTVGVMSEAVRLGTAMGVASSAADMVRTAMKPAQHMSYTQNQYLVNTQNSAQHMPNTQNPMQNQASAPAGSTWKCTKCGHEGNEDNYCEECGEARVNLWDCPGCGKKGNKGNFCPRCRTKRPVVSNVWKCPKCGHEGNEDNFCEECGYER